MAHNQKILSVLLKIWQVFCAVKMSEAKKFIPMTLMMFLVLFNFSTLRPIKDSLVVPHMGAEIISFVKLWCVFPSAILFTILYMKLSNILETEKLFYVVVSFFVSFFAIFAFLLYPYRDFLHPSPESIRALASSWPYLKWFIYLAGKWSFALFYVFAELWGAVMINLMFWQFANRITKTEEATRFYATFGLVGNVGLIFAGGIVKTFSKLTNELMIYYSMLTLILSSILLMAVYRWMNLYVLTDPQQYSPKRGSVKKKLKLSVLESLRMALNSKYLGYLVLLVICYGTAINLVEGPWKEKVRQLYPTQNSYAQFMGQFIQWTGIVTIVFMILGSNILKSFRWFTSAIITPLMILITGGGFFVFVIFEDALLPFTEDVIKLVPLALAVFLGSLQNVLSKATKYTMFDSTKEMAFIPLDDEFRTKGKAVVDVIGGRMAKSGGAVIQSFIFMLFPMATFSSIVPYLAVFFLCLMFIWIYVVNQLSKEYTQLISKE
ncbi:Npt1/Npt2 family nucleotide transporter [Candidatus Liberibacter asiaticus]|uniref:ADP,ATP carrier protein n=3 Tax=Liberibacter asiaticus TaxID=34021 RepID=C6XHQ3_LIBAP|nr:Npt1/Npt2 family nucleotide transporter [Candidatus Liberibacter asiaticus]ACT56796.1 ATP/ADP translocase [Candidatus Liberibacter asiaticus str. psy62]AGH16563.1 ATP/ADP translocase [Candidatus Liberibacter asiaticus str. gxpsy]ALK06955.1 NTP/NDP exchange transporter [Candidatus Liberibacter asiaticus]ASK53241.1 AAA family ATPase [Candidatus Liberibacter asiaticus]AWL13752.1 NTP/NDP exchange transporter [Candidatus Liberibacter asiaticus]